MGEDNIFSNPINMSSHMDKLVKEMQDLTLRSSEALKSLQPEFTHTFKLSETDCMFNIYPDGSMVIRVHKESPNYEIAKESIKQAITSL